MLSPYHSCHPEDLYWAAYRKGFVAGWTQATQDWADYKQPSTWTELAGMLLHDYGDCLSEWELNFLADVSAGLRFREPSEKQAAILARLAKTCGLKSPDTAWSDQ